MKRYAIEFRHGMASGYGINSVFGNARLVAKPVRYTLPLAEVKLYAVAHSCNQLHPRTNCNQLWRLIDPVRSRAGWGIRGDARI